MRLADLESTVLRLVSTHQTSELGSPSLATNGPSREKTPMPELNPVVSFDQLIANVSGCCDTADMVVSSFLLHVESQLMGLQDAIQSRDCARIGSAAHLQKGSLGAICALGARALAHEIELAARRGDAGQAQALFDQLRTLMVDVVATLSTWHATQAAATPTTPDSLRGVKKRADQPRTRTHESC
jgi:HPt (histidine-containing phosphotransfer) domain-containing protein